MTRSRLCRGLEYKQAMPLEISAFMFGKRVSDLFQANLELSCILPLPASFPHTVDDVLR